MNESDQIIDSGVPTSLSSSEVSPWFRVLLITALILGVFFRLSGLGTKIYSHDEVYTSLYAAGYRGGYVFTSLWDGKDKAAEDVQQFLKPSKNNNVAHIISLMAQYSPHQAPLFFILEYYWMQLIGYTPAAMRGLAALLGCLSVPAMYWFGKELFQSSRAAIMSTAFFAISPFHILFAQDARPYSLWALITIISGAAFLQAMRKNNANSWWIYSLTLILGVYSHQLFIMVAIVHGFYFIGTHFIRYKKNYGGFLSAGLFALLAYTPWLFFVITRWRHAASQLDVLNLQISWDRYLQRWILLFSSAFIDLDFNSNGANLVPYFLRVLMLILTAYAFVFLWKHGSLREKLLLSLIYIITVGTFIVLDLFFGGIRSITGRYFVPANIATVMIVAYFLSSRMHQPLSHGKWKVLAILLLVAGIVSNINSLYSETWWNKELSRVRLEFVNEINKDQSLIIVSGYHPTNLGDVLLLSLEVDSDIHFRLYENPADIEYQGNYSNIYWFPGTYQEVEEISTTKEFHITEVLPGLLWKIEGKNEE
jgi:uncharacterized membrane protein